MRSFSILVNVWSTHRLFSVGNTYIENSHFVDSLPIVLFFWHTPERLCGQEASEHNGKTKLFAHETLTDLVFLKTFWFISEISIYFGARLVGFRLRQNFISLLRRTLYALVFYNSPLGNFMPATSQDVLGEMLLQIIFRNV